MIFVYVSNYTQKRHIYKYYIYLLLWPACSKTFKSALFIYYLDYQVISFRYKQCTMLVITSLIMKDHFSLTLMYRNPYVT
jgi:hypothetical protein